MDNISLAIAHHQAGRLSDAELIYRKILQANPDHPEALHWLGVIAHQMGKNEAALLLIGKAISINPYVANYHSHNGMVLKGLKKYDEAINSFRQAIAMNPDYAEALNNLGNVYLVQCELNDAILSYQKALSLKPELLEACENIGNVLKIQGNMNRAAEFYERTKRINPETFHAQNSALALAIQHFLHDDLLAAGRELNFAKRMSGGISKEAVASQIYCSYLGFLLAWWANAPPVNAHSSDLKKLYVVGESHSLSLHKVLVSFSGENYACVAKWIEGCKQWHLANEQKNIYKYQVARTLNEFPAHATVLLTIGEIDCRHNAGIFYLWREEGGDILKIISKTVDGYLNWLTYITESKNIKFIINGVPATNASLVDMKDSEAKLFGQFLTYFNEYLKDAALLRGFGFLDVFALTDTGNGFANGSLHLDSHHLRPDSMRDAFAKYLTYPNYRTPT